MELSKSLDFTLLLPPAVAEPENNFELLLGTVEGSRPEEDAPELPLAEPSSRVQQNAKARR